VLPVHPSGRAGVHLVNHASGRISNGEKNPVKIVIPGIQEK
jgi:hypothetical protein